MKRVRIGIAGKLNLASSLVLLAVFSAALMLISSLVFNLSVAKERQAMNAYLVNTLGAVDDRLKDLGRATTLPVADARAQEILLGARNYNYREELDASEYLQKLFLSMVTSRSDITAMFLFDTDSLIAKYSLYTISVRGSFSLADNAWFQNNLRNSPLLSNGTRLMLGGVDSFLNTPTLDPFDNEYLTVLREINSFSPYERIGFMMVLTRMSSFNKILTKSIDEGARYVLADENGLILCESAGTHFFTPMSDVVPELANEHADRLTLDGEEYLPMSLGSSFSHLRLYVIKPMSSIYAEAHRTLTSVIAISTGAVLLVMLIIAFVTRRMVRPITCLADAMGSFSSTNTHPSVQVAEGGQDEVHLLSVSFNNMMDTINELIHSEYEKTIELKETQLRQKEMELGYLQSQINPHFLYNTLDTIRIKASINGDKEVARLIMLLVTFFRFGLGNSEAQVSIRHEVKLMQAYLQLMQCRYPSLEDEYALDETLMDTILPSFILQPLVENSLMHGLKGASYVGKLSLAVRPAPEPSDILIELADNGIGMSDGMIDRLNRGDCLNSEAVTHIGVRNVQERLKLFYGDAYGLTYFRNEQGGATARLRIARRIVIPQGGGDYHAS